MAVYGRGPATYTSNVIYHQVPSHCGGATHISEQRVFVDHFSSHLVRLLTPLAAIYGHLSTISHPVPSVFQHRRAFVNHLWSHPVCLPTSTGNCRPSLISSCPSSDVDVHLSTIFHLVPSVFRHYRQPSAGICQLSLISFHPSSSTTDSHPLLGAETTPQNLINKFPIIVSSSRPFSVRYERSSKALGGRRYLVEHPIK